MATYTVQAPDGHMITLEGPDGASHEDVIAQAQRLYSAPAMPGTEAFGGQAPGVPTAPLPMPLQKDVFGNRPVMGAPIMPSPMAGASVAGGLLSKLDEKTGMGQPGILGAPIMPAPARINSIQNADVTRPPGLLSSLPSKARAGQDFKTVEAAVGSVPIDTAAAGDIALRAKELATRGASLPKVVNDFLKRATEPGSPPITFKEGRDFASNAGNLSAGESMKAKPAMRRQIGLLADALDQANGEVAANGGVGNEYQSAMQNWRRASQMNAIGKKAGQAAVKAGVTGLLGGAAYGSYKTIKGLLEP